jgi:glycosyltransferase involved in cell wall biosynthesis
VLIRAFRAVPVEIQQRMELLIVGDGPLYDELSTMTVNDTNIHLLGFRHGPHLHELYAAADVFFFPSATETFGNVVLESFASGTPVIGADAGGVKELVRQGQTGWLCPSGDIPAFSQALVESVDNVALLAQMSAASKAYATLHSWDHIFDRLLTSYQAVQSESVTSMQSVAL